MAHALIVDDSPTAVAFLKKILREEGHEASALSCFVELPARLASDPPDIVILDLNLPAMSGESIGQFLRRYEYRSIPIVVFSGEPAFRLEAAARRLGAIAWVRKGTGRDQEELKAAIRVAVNERTRRVSDQHVRI